MVTSLSVTRRHVVVQALGGKCSCNDPNCWHAGPCQVEDPRCLQLDHINGDGAVDRKTAKRTCVANYYFNHLSEARERLQIMCANCNWVKRHRNGETRYGKPDPTSVTEQKSRLTADYPYLQRSMVQNRLTGLPEYVTLTRRISDLQLAAAEMGKAELQKYLAGHGLLGTPSRSLAYLLVRKWRRQHFYEDSPQHLSRFLQECLLELDQVEYRLRKSQGLCP